MFTGLIEETGSVLWIRATNHGTQLELSAPRIAGDVHTGESISVNGCCLTVASHRDEQVTFDLLEETVARTNLGAVDVTLAPNGTVPFRAENGEVTTDLIRSLGYWSRE